MKSEIINLINIYVIDYEQNENFLNFIHYLSEKLYCFILLFESLWLISEIHCKIDIFINIINLFEFNNNVNEKIIIIMKNFISKINIYKI